MYTNTPKLEWWREILLFMKIKTIQNYHYIESGLEYIFVKKVKSIQTPYGEAINIPNAKELHNKIAIAILENNIPLRGRELKFLRKTCEIKQVDLSHWLDLGQSTIANWEGLIHLTPISYNNYLEKNLIFQF